MKRLHIHSKVADLDAAIAFYSALFAAPPTVVKADYAKWMLDDPRVNFAISLSPTGQGGIEHLGIQSETPEELSDVYARLSAAGRPVMEEGATVCCYAQSEKSWISDPDGVVWEAFRTDGEAVVYGDSPDLDRLVSANAAEGNCCVPSATASGSCAPAAVTLGAAVPARTSCC